MLVVSLILAFVLSLVSAQWEIIPQRYDGMSGYLPRSSHILPQNYQSLDSILFASNKHTFYQCRCSLGFYNNPASQYQEQMINTHLSSLPGFSADLGPQFAQFGTQGLSNQFSPIMRSDIQSNIGYSNIDSLMGQRVSPQIGSMGIMNPIAQAGSSPLNPQLMPFGQFQTDSNQRMMSRESPTLSQAKPTRIIPPFMSGSTQEEQDKA
uniref:Uncharacterized protein n=1 Tax=Heterorhabditis bacteriophora TaxID=37862 RepID=A0A1I7XU40_HETBA